MRTPRLAALCALLGVTLARRARAHADAAKAAPAPGRAATIPQVGESARPYMAVSLDLQGRLSEALPLYLLQAEATRTKADRLQYAAALLRAGQLHEAKAVYNRLLAETESREAVAALCGSSALAAGFPSVALEYVHPAYRYAGRSDPSLGLLLFRSLAALGDVDAARSILAQLTPHAERWVVGQRLELARAEIVTGDLSAARRRLENDFSESVSQMFRDSILANLAVRDRDWARAATALDAAERKVPTALNAKRVDRAWRNAQRELRSMQLRRALSLWMDGQQERAMDAALNATRSDEEPVRSAAVMLLVTADLAAGHRTQAGTRLTALAGHDFRFADAVAQMQQAIAGHGEIQPAIAQLRLVLDNEDRAAEFITSPLFEALSQTTDTRRTDHRLQTPENRQQSGRGQTTD